MAKAQNDVIDTQRVCVIILGMHRSGSSILTRLFGALGCDLPSDSLKATAENRLGYWESEAVRELNDEVLQSAGSSWNDWRPFNPDWYDSPLRRPFVERGRQALRDAFGAPNLFALKDPRICRLVPLWFEILESEGIRPAVVIALRNPEEVANSLLRRDGFSHDEGLLLWLRHVLDAEYMSRGKPRIVATYDQVLRNWRDVAAASSASFDFSWPRLNETVSLDLQRHIDPSSRHNFADDERTLDNTAIGNWVRETFSLLRSWGEDPTRVNHFDDMASFDKIRYEFNTCLSNFSSLLSAGARHRIQLLEANDRLKQHAVDGALAHSKMEQLHARLGEAESQKAALEEALDNMRIGADQQATRISTFEAEMEKLTLESADAEARAVVRDKARQEEVESLRHMLAQSASKFEQRSEEANQAWKHADSFERLSNVLKRSLSHEQNARGMAEQTAVELESELALLRKQQRAYVSKAVSEKQENIEKAKSAEKKIGLLTTQLEKIKKDVQMANAEVEKGALALAAIREKADTRLDEIVVLTDLLRTAEKSTEALSWLTAVNRTMTRTPWWWGPMPAILRRRLILRRLKRQGLFDSIEYYSIYPDVANSGQIAIEHYISHGIYEGRIRPI